MILEKLKVNNFRVFEGEHEFDLNPRIKYGKKRPIILFGGLNGAGKTTTLTAVRLALYGKQSIGKNVSVRDYEDYLAKSIHRPKNGDIAPSNASIELTFSYATMGTNKQYLVKRSWYQKGKTIKEAISITENNQHHSELNTEQCQGFLNELIPIGVSDLFFFDGEKIAELAEDTKGAALGDSIKKLLGLDLIETLDADLGILLREQSKKSSSEDSKETIEKLEKLQAQFEIEAARELALYEQAKPAEHEADKTIAKLEQELSSRGGAWAATREEEIKRQTMLSEEKRQIEKMLREIIEDQYPLSLAENFVKHTLRQLTTEATYKRSSQVAEIVDKRLSTLDKRLKSLIDETSLKIVQKSIRDEFSDVIKPTSKTKLIHDISDRSLSHIEGVIENALTYQRPKVQELTCRLSQISDELDRVGTNIARAPQEAQIKPYLEEIAKAHKKRTASHSEQKLRLENYKRLLREALTVTRQLEIETSKITSDSELARTTQYAVNAQGLLRDFASEMAKRKVADLEKEFINSFHRLARKGDADLRASIDATNFTVLLHRNDGSEIDKDELSAGEKQIYAISILEALARTSGRHLPIIIDTPLGRLDSVHRSKLINHYFPTASHQVIILSTDTEVDEDFYADLSSNISHAYKLDYDVNTASTFASEGYFWREKKIKSRAG